MAHLPNTRFPDVRPSLDGKWLRCPKCSLAYWGAFRPTDFIAGKLAAHLDKAHKDAGAPAPDAQLAKPAKAQRPAPRARNAAKVAKIAAKAAAKGDGPARIVTPNAADLLGADIADMLADLQFDPRLQLGQGPRMFPDQAANRRPRRVHISVAAQPVSATSESPSAAQARIQARRDARAAEMAVLAAEVARL